MEILALYTSADTLETALTAGARHLAAALEGFALVYQLGPGAPEPEGWAGFTCAGDAKTASERLADFRRKIESSDRPLRSDAPQEPSRIWSRAAGGLYGFPLRHAGQVRGAAIVGCPGRWPRIRNAETESILRQLALVLDHHAVSNEDSVDREPSEEQLELSEQLLGHNIDLIRKRADLTRIEAARAELIGRVAEELRLPLQGIVERVVSVLADDHEGLSKTGRESLRTVLDHGQALARMLQNVADLGRIREGQTRLDSHIVDPSELVDEALFSVRDKLRDGVVLEKRLAPALPRIRTDLAVLSQILFQLLDNAAKFTRQGRILLEMHLEADRLIGSVVDTGIGISPADQRRIFEEFFQVDQDRRSPQRGAGLGLAITHALAEQLEGSVSVSSEVGSGSRFTFEIPVTVVS